MSDDDMSEIGEQVEMLSDELGDAEREIEQLKKEKQAIVDGMNHLVCVAQGKLERYRVAAEKWHRVCDAIKNDPKVRELPDYILDEYYDETECGL